MKKLGGWKIGGTLSNFFLVFVFGKTKKAGVNHDVRSSSSLQNGGLLIAPSTALFVITCRPAMVNAATINDNDRMVAAALTATGAQLTTTTDIPAATISQRHHHHQCHHIIIVINDSSNNTIATIAISCHCCQWCPTLASPLLSRPLKPSPMSSLPISPLPLAVTVDDDRYCHHQQAVDNAPPLPLPSPPCHPRPSLLPSTITTIAAVEDRHCHCHSQQQPPIASGRCLSLAVAMKIIVDCSGGW
jgi:hypothetical protein